MYRRSPEVDHFKSLQVVEVKIPRAFKIELAVMVDENDAQQAFLGMPSCLLSILAWFCLLLRCTSLDATLPTTKLSHSHVI